MKLPILLLIALSGSLKCPEAQYRPRDSKDTCTPCPQGCFACEERDGVALCSNCYYGFFLDENFSCDPCIGNCATCVGIELTHCLTTNPGYFFDKKNAKIASCGVDKCQSCREEGSCLSCQAGFYLRSESLSSREGRCLACPDNCERCSLKADQIKNSKYLSCDVCATGYGLSEGECSICSPNCSKCEGGNGKCLVCFPGFMLVSKWSTPPIAEGSSLSNIESGFEQRIGASSCVAAIDNCFLAKDASSCLICEQSFYPREGKCFACSETHPNCQNCALVGPAPRCSECRKGYFLTDENSCQICSDNCDRCGSAGCLKCREEFFLDSKEAECKKCTIPFCYLCDSPDRCQLCLQGYYVDRLTKTCAKCPGSCLVCSSADRCDQCKLDSTPLVYFSREKDDFLTVCFETCPDTFHDRKVLSNSALGRCT